MTVKVYLDEKKFGDQITKKNLWRKSLAAMVEISPSYLSQLANGRRCPSPRLRQKFLKTLQCKTFDDLFFIKEKDAGERTKAAVPLSKGT